MLRVLNSVLMLAGIALLLACPAVAESVRTPHVEAELVAAKTAIVPGEPVTVAARLVMARGWHTYWRNPGDSGLPTTLEWTLPQGWRAGEIQWPVPQALPVGPLMNYGYEGEVLLPVALTPPAGIATGDAVTLSARADWLVCREICIPEGATLSLRLPVETSASPDPQWGVAIANTLAALPRPLSGWKVGAVADGNVVRLKLDPVSNGADPGTLRFFPYADGQIEPAGRQTAIREGSATTLTLPVARQRTGEFNRVAGVITASEGFGGRDKAAIIDVALEGTLAPPAAAASPAAVLPLPSQADGESALSLGVALMFAFAGGLLLNLMPCVFPVLSLKVLGFATHGESSASMRRHGLAFAAGVVASFWLLAAALVGVRGAGAQLGWGFQLQSPVVVASLAVLFFVLALNLSGVFEVRQFVPASIAGWNARNAYVNDALSGALAVVVASPCSAPFMGAALGYALSASVPVTWATFTALGVGMAFPYMLLAIFPGWRTRLPKPGAWMVRLRQLLAFPLYASALWLAWVLGAQLDVNAVARLGATLLLVALALWAWPAGGAQRAAGMVWRCAATASLVAALICAWPLFSTAGNGSPAPVAEQADGRWQPFSAERVSELTTSGKPVFVDFTAAWCVTCQVNKKLVLNTAAVEDAFERSGVARVRADWTRRDAAIASALAALGRSGVPVYVLYRPGKPPLLLPEVLQQRIILDALATL